MKALVLCVLLTWQYGIDEVCERGRCYPVRGAITYTGNYLYLKLDSCYYTFVVDRFIESERLLQLHARDCTGFLLLRTNYAVLVATPRNKRNKERILKLHFYYAD